MDIGRDLSALPTATVIQTYRKMLNTTMKRPPDAYKTVAFALGAKLLGIEFPDRYNGEWCVGYSDHEWGVFPSDTIRLDTPRQSDIRMQGSSNLKAVARWKWSPKEKERGDWLRFEKGEVITGIGCKFIPSTSCAYSR